MKKLLLCLCAVALFGCKEDPKEEPAKDYVTFAGKIENPNSDSLFVYLGRDWSKTIKVAPDGTFKDTFKIAEPNMYGFYDGSESSSLFLKNGYDLNLTLNTEEFDETIAYTGEGAVSNNFLAEKSRFEEKIFDVDALSDLDSTAFVSKIAVIKSDLNNFYNSNKEVDSIVIAKSNESLEPMVKSFSQYINQKIALKKALPKGSESPSFKDYENYAGGKMSLNDLKGKYAYLDIWATWCGPCKAEIPALKELDEAYKDKNIQFVSISIDDERAHKGSMEKAHEAWMAMVKDKELTGVQLMAPKGWESQFIRDYQINGIPRFILLDPEGKIVTADAPRPSSPKLKELFGSLGI
ncbi:TlpA family protein disulfide reductase [Aurantibacter aestuarii]|uniref:Thioredoxin n=1 Tax=Aurantibacter aestuarii TaxID=1266046 RepID=A0A2T1N8X1_9FLAO|nr:TlpA disulfide reductase family protein [Aurantibacter aestuarii]PSG88327.1 thioredoxin [Aurantibacter aestuarii]